MPSRIGFDRLVRLGRLVPVLPLLLCLVPDPASALDTVAPYLGLYGGVVIPQGESWKGDVGGNSAKERFQASYKTGLTAGIVTGYDYGDWRFEVEAGYQTSAGDRAKNVKTDGIARGDHDLGGHLNVWSVLANGYYDMETGSTVTPFVGIGLGVAAVSAKNIDVRGEDLSLDDSDMGFAYQGIAGVKLALSDTLSINASYRYFGTAGVTVDGAKTQYHAHVLVAGLTYTLLSDILPDFNPPQLNPPPKPVDGTFARSYVVFFDWDSSLLSAEADAIIADAAKAAISLGSARIELTGHTDRSGSVGYNQALSQRRAEAVKQRLIELGMDGTEITTLARGESAPLVPTPDGVREPQNRRVEIVL